MNYVRTRAVFQERGKVVGASKTVSEARIAIMGNENAHTHKKEKRKRKCATRLTTHIGCSVEALNCSPKILPHHYDSSP